MPAGTIVSSGSLVSPGGQQGVPGPNAVSADAGNQTTFGSDNKIFTPLPPLVSSSSAGLMATLPNTGKAYFRDDGTWVLPGSYYGGDATNTGAYVVSVATDFKLFTGVVVYFFPSNANAGAPTLNVNGTGVKPIVNRGGYGLLANEIIPNRITGVLYNGASWCVITPLARYAIFSNPANVNLECAGFDSVTVVATFSSATGAGIILNHVGLGVPIFVDILNTTGAAMSYYINVTNSAGTTLASWFVPVTATTGTTVTRIDSTTAASLTNGYRFLTYGQIMEIGTAFFK